MPEDIQKEIIQQYNIKKSPENANLIKSPIKNVEPNLKTETCKNENNKNNSPNLNNEVHNNENNSVILKKEQNHTGMFLGMNLSEVRQLLREWVSSENEPEPCDIEMLSEYFKNLALTSKIEDLFVMLKYLYK